jgi:hypothetical protein
VLALLLVFTVGESDRICSEGYLPGILRPN